MGLFQFIIILVLIISLTEMVTKIMVPVARRLADLLAEMARERKALREGPAPAPGELSAAAVESLENRLARIEDRLDFIEELRAPPSRAALSATPVRESPAPE